MRHIYQGFYIHIYFHDYFVCFLGFDMKKTPMFENVIGERR